MGKKNYKITGKSVWAKIFGEPTLNYNEDGNEWSIDVEPDEASLNLLERLGLGHKVLRKGSVDKNGKTRTRTDYITFARAENNKMKGAPNNPIPVEDADGNDWPEDTSIGNGSKVEIKFGIFEVPPKGKFKGGPKPVIYGVKVLELVEYKRPEPKKKTAATAKPDANAEESYGETESQS